MKKLYLIIFILFISCNKNGNFENLITHKDKHWFYFYDKPDTLLKNIYFYKFSNDGIINTTMYLDGEEEETLFNFENKNPKPEKWNYNKSDSILSFYGYNFKIIRFVSDTIVVKNLKSNTNSYFVNMKLSK